MRFVPLEIPDVLRIEPDVHRDERGFFLEIFHAGKYAEGGVDAVFVQDNHSRSGRGALRGLHLQEKSPQGKLVRVSAGAVWDVVVDVRKDSPHFGKWVACELNAENFHQIWAPPGVAHGFFVLSESADVEYKCTALYAPDDEVTIAWDDPDLAIDWRTGGAEPLLSNKDRAGLSLAAWKAR